MLRSLVAASALSLTMTAASAAVAADGPWVPKTQGSRLGGDIDWWPTDSSHTVAFGLVGQIQLGRVVYLDFDVPLAVWDRRTTFGSRDGTFVFGNPTVGVHWADTINSKVAAFAGGTFTVSTLISDTPYDLQNDLDRQEAYGARSFAFATRAYADVHRFVPDYVFLRGRGGLEVRILPVLYYRFEAVPIIAIPVGYYVSDPEFLFEIHNEIEGRSTGGVGGGLHLQAVFIPTGLGAGDSAQLALEPYFTYEPVRGFYARLGALVALDRPLGFGLNEGKVATFRVSLGGKW
jgi:hypothetical protein